MPTLITDEPDSHDLDYYYNKYPDRFGIGAKETDPLTLRILPKDVNPTKCEPNKQQHYFKMPFQPILSTCLCNKYHTNFTSKHYKITYTTPPRQSSSSSAMDISPTTVISKNHFNNIVDKLPNSPITKQQRQNLLSTSQILPSSFHTDPLPVAIVLYSQYYHSCTLYKKKDIPCVLIQETCHAPDYSAAVIFKGFLFHRDCVHSLQYTKLKPLPQTQELTKEQRSIFHLFYFYKLTKEEKMNFLQKLALRGKEKSQNSKQTKQNQQQKNMTNQPRDTSNDLDWFLNYPISENMEPNTKLNTSLAQQLFNFSKIHLRKFT